MIDGSGTIDPAALNTPGNPPFPLKVFGTGKHVAGLLANHCPNLWGKRATGFHLCSPYAPCLMSCVSTDAGALTSSIRPPESIVI